MTKTMSIRMDEENYDFLNRLSKEERGDMSKAVRELVNKGRLMLAVERYKEGKASLGLAAELADLTLGEMINVRGTCKTPGRQWNKRQGLGANWSLGPRAPGSRHRFMRRRRPARALGEGLARAAAFCA